MPAPSGGGGFNILQSLQNAFTTFLNHLPSLIGALVVLIIGVSAIGTLNIPAVTQFMNLVLSYLPNVLAALLTFLVAAAVAAAVGGLVHRTMGDTPTDRVARSAAPTLVMAVAVFMILNQLAIAETIVTVTYVALFGAVALGSALAFGLGGRDAAKDLIDSGYRAAQQQPDQVRADLRTGRDRGEAEARHDTRQDTFSPASPTESTVALDPQGNSRRS